MARLKFMEFGLGYRKKFFEKKKKMQTSVDANRSMVLEIYTN
jgi:hypothetical protein